MANITSGVGKVGKKLFVYQNCGYCAIDYGRDNINKSRAKTKEKITFVRCGFNSLNFEVIIDFNSKYFPKDLKDYKSIWNYLIKNKLVEVSTENT